MLSSLKRPIVRMGVAVALASSLSGCFAMTYDAHTLPEIGMSAGPIAQTKVVGTLSREYKVVWVAGGLLPVYKPDMASDLREQTQGRRVQNLAIRSEMSLMDGLITGVLAQALTLGTTTLMFIPNAQGMSTLVLVGGSLVLPHFRTITVRGELVEPLDPGEEAIP